MENGSLVALSGQMALARRLDIVANNIANLNTTGFKADNTVFQEYLSPRARENRFNLPDRRPSFVLDRGTWHDLGQGPVQPTGNPLDVAIDGNAFLVVQTREGERYTRNGSLQINAAGELVTTDGARVMGDGGPIVFQQLDRDIVISADGRITVTEGANTKTESLRGKLRLVSFANPQGLQKDGANNFAAPPGMTPAPDTKARVTQGAVEKSNVNGVTEMTRMIAITRAYQDIATMLRSQGELRRNAIQQLADVPA